MKRVVFDSYALIALFRQEAGHEFVRDILVKMANDEIEGFISAVNVGAHCNSSDQSSLLHCSYSCKKCNVLVSLIRYVLDFKPKNII